MLKLTKAQKDIVDRVKGSGMVYISIMQNKKFYSACTKLVQMGVLNATLINGNMYVMLND